MKFPKPYQGQLSDSFESSSHEYFCPTECQKLACATQQNPLEIQKKFTKMKYSMVQSTEIKNSNVNELLFALIFISM